MLIGAAVSLGIAAHAASAQQRVESALHGVWHGTIKDYTGKMSPRLQIEVSPDSGCHWMAASPGAPRKYQRTGCQVDYRSNIVTLEIPRQWSLSLKLESDALVGIFIEGSGTTGSRYNISMMRGPWTE